ncbi:DUF58 domain-containing protein [Rubritalea marina]|uniref:DUF58 domain-containing protein n=1 Tax=Rubritalea marina TaxID=361055 RepID=UPI00037D235F|nr:DUF58 domain-containing protein [Rubritalea marina]
MDWSRVKRVKAEHPEETQGVYTSLEELIRFQFLTRDFSFLPSQPVQSILAGRYASHLRGRGLNFEELRKYLVGDDVRMIDWKVTARTRSPYVRVYTEEKDRSVLVLCDQRINMFWGTRERLKSVTAAQAVALASWRATAVGDRVGAVIFNDEAVIKHRPKRGQQGVMQVLDSVVKMNHQLHANTELQSNDGMLNEALKQALKMVTHDMLVVVVSDFYGVDKTTEKLVAKLAQHNDVLGILVTDPVREAPSEQRVTASDGTLQAELPFERKAVRDMVAESYREERRQITHFMRKLSAPLLEISNEGDVVNQVRKLLGVPTR